MAAAQELGMIIMVVMDRLVAGVEVVADFVGVVVNTSKGAERSLLTPQGLPTTIPLVAMIANNRRRARTCKWKIMLMMLSFLQMRKSTLANLWSQER